MIRQRARRAGTVVALGCAGALVAGVIAALLVETRDAGSWLFRNGWLVWVVALNLIALTVATALHVALGREGRAAPKVALGALLFPALLAMFVIGIFVPYWGGWGGLELQELENDADIAWRTLLMYLFGAALVSGAFFGAFVGLLSWASRFLGLHG